MNPEYTLHRSSSPPHTAPLSPHVPHPTRPAPHVGRPTRAPPITQGLISHTWPTHVTQGLISVSSDPHCLKALLSTMLVAPEERGHLILDSVFEILCMPHLTRDSQARRMSSLMCSITLSSARRTTRRAPYVSRTTPLTHPTRRRRLSEAEWSER